MSARATYRKLLSPVAQIEAAEDFIGEMESMVADTWAMRETPEDTARANSDSATEFLEELQSGRFVLDALNALKKCEVRFESDVEEEGEGYFHLLNRVSMSDFILHSIASDFSLEVSAFAPEGWSRQDTTQCLGYENLVVVPDDTGSVIQAVDLIGGAAAARIDAENAAQEPAKGDLN